MLISSIIVHVQVDKLILIDEIKPASVSFVNRAQFLAGAIDEQIDNDEKVEESQDSRKFNYDEGIAREIESSNGELSEDAAKLLFVSIAFTVYVLMNS